ncbi:hypothetical protein DY000_02060237 [Brassica cretica]|uniref:Uncharacterized protein n=1 Tax=Brassica cretica TaxID=69181 RepID=A0ABQ7AYM3_BRACR|nr:hypothetical protein DY000_02060237 [Brassica cretica]
MGVRNDMNAVHGASIEEHTRMHRFGSYPLIDVRDSSVSTLGIDDKGMSYYECKEFEDHGFHIRHRCFDAIEEELQELKDQVAEEAKSRRKMEDEMKILREEIKELKELLMYRG